MEEKVSAGIRMEKCYGALVQPEHWFVPGSFPLHQVPGFNGDQAVGKGWVLVDSCSPVFLNEIAQLVDVVQVSSDSYRNNDAGLYTSAGYQKNVVQITAVGSLLQNISKSVLHAKERSFKIFKAEFCHNNSDSEAYRCFQKKHLPEFRVQSEFFCNTLHC